MYPGFDVSILLPEAEKFSIDNDRKLYDPFFELAEKFCTENGILIGGKIGLDLITNSPQNRDGYFWELYTDNAFEIAKKFAKALSETDSPHVPARTVALRTDIRHHEFTIMINANFVFKIYGMDRYRGVQLIDAMKPGKVTGWYGNDVGVIPEEIQLIDIYRTLYSPSRMKNWNSALKSEEIVYEKLRQRINHIVVGGAKFNKSMCDEVIINKLLSQSDIGAVIIGDYSFGHLSSDISDTPSKRLQFISDMNIDDLASRVEKIIIRDKNSARLIGVPFGAKVSAVKFNLNIPSDFQIVKHTLYVSTGLNQDQIPIADIFNSTEYELIPFIKEPKKQIKIGNPFVVLKFIFVDIWTIRLIINMMDTTSQSRGVENLQYRMTSLLSYAGAIRKELKKSFASDPTSVFQLDNYLGVSINETVAKKKFIKETGERFGIIYPAKNVE